MSFLLGETRTLERTPEDVQGLRRGFAEYLQGQLPFLYGGEPSAFFTENLLEPTRELFAQNRARGLAQAKEAAGTLTGSGFASRLGSEVSRSLAQENALLAEMLNQERQRILSALLGFGTAGVGAPQPVYQPGFLDYLFQGAQSAAPIFASGGGGSGTSTGGG